MLLSLFLPFMPVLSFADQCLPNVDSCGFYLCEEEKSQCGSRGYPLGFGFKFCQVFLNTEHRYSPEAHLWLRQVRVCLMETYVEAQSAQPQRTCGEIKSQSFRSHVGCYEETGFCELRTQDQMKIFWALRESVIYPEVYQDAQAVLRTCALRKAQSPEAPIVQR